MCMLMFDDLCRCYIGRVLGLVYQDLDWWDKKLFFGVVVFLEIGKFGYCMYYYGCVMDEWVKGVMFFNVIFLIGRNGMVVSEDGFYFE